MRARLEQVRRALACSRLPPSHSRRRRRRHRRRRSAAIANGRRAGRPSFRDVERRARAREHVRDDDARIS